MKTPCSIPQWYILYILLFLLLCLLIFYETPRRQLELDLGHHSLHLWNDNPELLSFYNRYEHWQADWINNTDLKSLFIERNHVISERCDHIRDRLYNFKYTTAISRGSFLQNKASILEALSTNNTALLRKMSRKIPQRIVPGPGLKYCASGKTGTTFTVRALELISRLIHDRNPSSPKKITFTTVRNPWHRLVSLYLNKLDQPDFFTRDLTCPPAALLQEAPRQVQPTFSDLIDCILEYWKLGFSNIHWYPSITRCEICTNHYDYIVRTEHLSPELEHIVTEAHIPEKVIRQALRVERNSSPSKSFQKLWKDIKEEDIVALQEIYKDEIYILGYPSTPFTDSPYA